jgi:hypothetical protein
VTGVSYKKKNKNNNNISNKRFLRNEQFPRNTANFDLQVFLSRPAVFLPQGAASGKLREGRRYAINSAVTRRFSAASTL